MLRNAKRSSLRGAAAVGGNPQDLRSTKIFELKTRCPGLLERVADSEFSLSFSCGGTEYLLIITLPIEFPFASPVLSVQPPAQHPLLDEASTVCGITDLTAFSIHASLPDIVHQVLSEFITVPLSKRQDSATSAASSSSGIVEARSPPMTMYMNGTIPSGTLPGDVRLRSTSIYSEVNALSVDDLREWSTDDMKVKEFAERLPHVRTRKEALRQLAESNEALAKANLSTKDGLDEKRCRVLALYEELSQSKQQFDTSQETFRLLERSYNPQTLKDGLARSAQEAEEESDGIAQQFLNKELEVDEFLRRFMETRTRSHERSAKAERLHLQLEALHRAGF
ncbi:vacuolar protein sorting-associated protein 37A-like [Tropilaelaps mercedesae]|uniref:Vacuolar protein sorting-associated protein 37A-like n=1 Tax=Tropilaelaps mercedesae TaxID=418985 RepID=A0A1V9XQZ3_9ACAR|nr:vacuolar protein sorting-associated protein 37A-like [Tropilaelaps mercedesae]